MLSIIVQQELRLKYLLREPEERTRGGRDVHYGTLCYSLEYGRSTHFTHIAAVGRPNLFEEETPALHASAATRQGEWHLRRVKSCNATCPRHAG